MPRTVPDRESRPRGCKRGGAPPLAWRTACCATKSRTAGSAPTSPSYAKRAWAPTRTCACSGYRTAQSATSLGGRTPCSAGDLAATPGAPSCARLLLVQPQAVCLFGRIVCLADTAAAVRAGIRRQSSARRSPRRKTSARRAPALLRPPIHVQRRARALPPSRLRRALLWQSASADRSQRRAPAGDLALAAAAVTAAERGRG